MHLPLRALIAAPLLLALPALAADARLQRGIAAFDDADFAKARAELAPLALDPSVSPDDQATAELYLAASYHALGDASAARAVLTSLAVNHPAVKPDPAVFLPQFVSLADEVRAQVAAEHKPSAPPPPRPEPAPPPVSVERAPAPLGTSWVPFGVGQFTNGQPAKGYAFLGTEVVAFGTCAVTLAMLEGMKDPGGVALQSGTIPDARLGTAQTLNVVQFIAFWAGVAVTAVGVADGIASRPPAASATLTVTGDGLRVRF